VTSHNKTGLGGPADTVHIVGICGSLRGGSYTRRALRIALEGAERYGASTELIDLREYDLVFCDGKIDPNELPVDVSRMRGAVRKAHGILLATPEYHGSFSGVLKNALDLMGFEEFEGKLVGLVGVSGGKVGAVNALNGLRGIGRALHAWVIPQQVSVPQAWKAFTDDGTLKDKKLSRRLEAVGETVAKYAALHTSDTAAEFVRLWEEAPANPGG